MRIRSGINNFLAVLVHAFELIEIIIIIICVVYLTTPENTGNLIIKPVCTEYGCGCNNF